MIAMRRATKFTIVAMRRVTKLALVTVIAAMLAKQTYKSSYKNAKLHCLVKRFIGFLASRALKFPIPTVVSGVDSTSKVADLLKELGCKKPLIVTDENIVKFGLAGPCLNALNAAGFKAPVFKDVVPNPPSELIDAGYDIYLKEGCDSIIAFGGGSPMDVAKVIGAKVCNPKPICRYEGFFMVNFFSRRSLPPLIAVPTTAGTGSETTIAAVITMTKERRKVKICDLGLVPKVAVLDPNVLVKLPKQVTAATGMDALTHAIEAYLGGWTDAYTNQMSLKAVEKIFTHLLPSYHDGANLEARDKMLHAAFEAGVAFTRANVGYVHAIAHQFGGLFHTPHGDANAMLLPHVLEFYLRDEGEGSSTSYCTDRLCELAQAGGLVNEYDQKDLTAKRSLARKFIDRIRQMNAEMALPSEVQGMKVSDVNEVAARACRETNGEEYGLDNILAAVLSLGYPVPKYMTEAQCQEVVVKCLPSAEKQTYTSVLGGA